MWIRRLPYALFAAYLLGAAVWVLASGVVRNDVNQIEILHVACDPTRELWKDLNAEFLARYQANTGTTLTIRMSHGGSSSQARAVVDSLDADFVSLAMYPDTDAIRKAGRIDTDWVKKLPNKSLPYTSTMVMVVRKGNPKQVHQWADLKRTDIEIITPNPKTSGNGKWSFLALYGSVTQSGGSIAEAEEFLLDVYRRVPVLDTSARAATMTFAQKNIGDVHITWENEAHLEVAEAKGSLEIIYPATSVLAEPHVAVVDSVAKAKGTTAVMEAYTKFLYTREAQEIIARHHHRPIDPVVIAASKDRYPVMTFFTVRDLAPSWDDINDRFFNEGALFDQLFSKARVK
jgi:sulfate/thiosulfate transport system substrate-binding protein